jgi:hypothetical protein
VTAQELYEIVKDVDRAAWPKTNGVTYHYRLEEDGPHDVEWWFWGGTEEDPSGHVEARMVLLEAAFVGSMVAWLIGKGYHVHGWDSNSDTSTATLVLYDREFSVSTDKYRGMGTIVALLAAACKEARP